MSGISKVAALLGAAAVLVLQTGSAGAALVFTGSGTNPLSGDWLSATASFDTVNQGTELQITLANLGGPAHVPSDVLTAVFFNLSGVTTLKPVSAVLGSGSVLLNGPLSSGLSLGDNWEYLSNLAGIPGQPTQGISAAGLGVFGQGNFGTKSQNLRGADYGLVNGTVSSTDRVLAGLQLENNTMVFTLSGLPAGFSLSAVSDVELQYGTTLAPAEPMLVAYPVPEPAALALLALGGSALFLFRRTKG